MVSNLNLKSVQFLNRIRNLGNGFGLLIFMTFVTLILYISIFFI